MFNHTHASGRFTATPEQEEAALDYYMQRSDEVTVTEVDAAVRSRCLREPGWFAVFGNKGSRDDCGIAIRESKFDVLDSGTSTLSELRYMTERGTLSDTTEGAYAVTQNKRTGEVGVTVVVHMPHGMQDDLRTGNIVSDVAKAYRSIVAGTRKLARRLTLKHKAQWTMIVGDWNLNIKKLWVRAYFKVNFPEYRVNFTPPYPTRGTFGPQLIDLALLRGIRVTKGPVILRHEPGFDHVGWVQTLS